ncbi:MAG: DUF4230 domain-containing protein [Lachnospira sp.]|nr:DUF4230 domain-containing protein [Lachnospira sp.]
MFKRNKANAAVDNKNNEAGETVETKNNETIKINIKNRNIGILTRMICFGLGCLVTFIVMIILGFKMVKSDKVSTTSDDGLSLLGETQVREVTVEEVKVKLEEIGELSTYQGTYSITYGKKETRELLEKFAIPFTSNNITIECEGVVKIGYDLDSINVEVAEADKKIFISIPEAKINDNYVIWDTMNCSEENNILNPIDFSQYQELISEIEEKGLEEVENDGIYTKAEDNLKLLIEKFLGDFEEYEIVFM